MEIVFDFSHFKLFSQCFLQQTTLAFASDEWPSLFCMLKLICFLTWSPFLWGYSSFSRFFLNNNNLDFLDRPSIFRPSVFILKCVCMHFVSCLLWGSRPWFRSSRSRERGSWNIFWSSIFYSDVTLPWPQWFVPNSTI